MAKKYVATRREVCGEQLLKTQKISFKIYDQYNRGISEEELEKQGVKGIKVSGGLVCRGMLFNIDDNGLANDLIYTTPVKYPVEGVRPNINVESEFVINHYVELEELLKYLKYGVDLTQKDLDQIHRKLISHKWWLEHHKELFGWEKLRDERTGSPMGYGSGGIQTVPKNIYESLSWISCSEQGKPHREEPGYSLIKKRQF